MSSNAGMMPSPPDKPKRPTPLDYAPWRAPTSRISLYRWIILVPLCLGTLGALWYVGSVGYSIVHFFTYWDAGKHRISPDGRFKAEGLVHSSPGRSWCTMTVTDLKRGAQVFYYEQPILPGDKQPTFDQGNAGDGCIVWSADSSTVEFIGKNQARMSVSVH